MKITTFNPLIVTGDPEAVIGLFEALGFQRQHDIEVDGGGFDINSIRLKNDSGFYVDVATTGSRERDLTIIRMNVDNFDEAYEFLTARGFTNPRGDHTVNSKTNKSAMLKSPSGFAFDLCQHIK